MTTSSAKLLRDADALADYAARHGCMPAGSKVFEALAAGPRNADPVQISREIDALVKAIGAPMVRRLNRERLALEVGGRIWRRTKLFAIGLITVLLTMYLTFESLQLHEADTALRAYQEWVAQQPREKLYAAFKMYRYERVLSVTAPPLGQLDAYQKLVDEANRLAAKGDAIQGLLQKAHTLQIMPPLPGRLVFDWYPRLAAKVNGNQVQLGRSPAEEKAVLAGLTELKPIPTTFPPGAGAAFLGDPGAADARCVIEMRAAPLKAGAAKPPAPTVEEIEKYESGWLCFLKRLRLDEHRLNYSPWPVIYEIQLKINVLVTWLLPALYGSLGACVYLLRGMLLGHADMERSVLLSLVMRIALGGVAGIIIGWFWVPTAGVQISSIPFGMAFLAGFSIDTLFSLLDRLNKKASDVPEPKPKEA